MRSAGMCMRFSGNILHSTPIFWSTKRIPDSIGAHEPALKNSISRMHTSGSAFSAGWIVHLIDAPLVAAALEWSGEENGRDFFGEFRYSGARAHAQHVRIVVSA